MSGKFIFTVLAALLLCATCVYASEGHGHGAMMGQMALEKTAMQVGNKICPVSGEDVSSVGTLTKVEYKGKIYNLCCPGCLSQFNADPEKYVKIVEQNMAQRKGMMGEAKTEEINLEAYQFGYSPDPVVVKQGDSVVIHATSRDVPHGIFIKEYGINATVKKGEVTDIKFVADKAGEFDIICSVYCGKGHRNMKAKLIVEKS